MRLEGYYPKEYRYQGFESEEECIGQINWPNILKNINLPKEKLTKKQWIKIIKENYPLNPLLPKKKWSKDLVNFLEEKLELKEDREVLEFYNTLGSPLDKMGVDCLLSFKNLKTKEKIDFAIDITRSKSKEDWEIDKEKPSEWGAKKPKADFVIDIKKFPDHHSNPQGYIQTMDEVSEEIAATMKEKIGPIIH